MAAYLGGYSGRPVMEGSLARSSQREYDYECDSVQNKMFLFTNRNANNRGTLVCG